MNDYSYFFIWLAKKISILLCIDFVISLIIRVLFKTILESFDESDLWFDTVIIIYTIMACIFVLSDFFVTRTDNQYRVKCFLFVLVFFYGIVAGVLLTISSMIIYYVIMEIIVILLCFIDYFVTLHDLFRSILIWGVLLTCVCGIWAIYYYVSKGSINWIVVLVILAYFVFMIKGWESQEKQSSYYKEKYYNMLLINYKDMLFVFFPLFCVLFKMV